MNKEKVFHSGYNKYSTILQLLKLKKTFLNVCLFHCDANHMMLMQLWAGHTSCHSTCLRVQAVIMAIDKLKGPLWLNVHSDTASDSSTHLPFLPLLQYDSCSAHRFHSPSDSQLLVESKPSCPSSSSDVWMTRRCSERHWTTQCGGASLKPTRSFSLCPGHVKVHPRPPWLPSSHVH